jgi:uncharacterized protein YxjI
MIYKVREKIFSIGDQFAIEDETGRLCYYVRSKIFTMGNKLYLEDPHGNELYFIEQKLLRFLPEYTISSRGTSIATVKKALTFMKHRFDIRSALGTFEISGNPWAHDFTITKNRKVVVEVSKRWVSLSDTYGVSVDDGEDQAFALSLVIVIDQVLHDKN